jgi:ketosteroid isomerase-like protein
MSQPPSTPSRRRTRRLSQENVELAQRILGHLVATGQVLWDKADREIEVHDHDTPDQGDYLGHEGLARWLEDWGAAWAGWSIEPDEFIDAGSAVVIFIRMKAEGRGSGIKVDRQDALVYEIRNGMVTRVDYYNDRKQALKAAGLAE